MAVIAPPLLHGSAAGSSLRGDWRRLEDKLVAHRCDIRPFCLNLDTSSIHKNRELPNAYILWLAIADSTLPNKGTAYRALRHPGSEPVPAAQINEFRG